MLMSKINFKNIKKINYFDVFLSKKHFEKQSLPYSQIDPSRAINNSRIVHIQYYGQSQKLGIKGIQKTQLKELTTR